MFSFLLFKYDIVAVSSKYSKWACVSLTIPLHSAIEIWHKTAQIKVNNPLKTQLKVTYDVEVKDINLTTKDDSKGTDLGLN